MRTRRARHRHTQPLCARGCCAGDASASRVMRRQRRTSAPRVRTSSRRCRRARPSHLTLLLTMSTWGISCAGIRVRPRCGGGGGRGGGGGGRGGRGLACLRGATRGRGQRPRRLGRQARRHHATSIWAAPLVSCPHSCLVWHEHRWLLYVRGGACEPRGTSGCCHEWPVCRDGGLGRCGGVYRVSYVRRAVGGSVESSEVYIGRLGTLDQVAAARL